MTLQKLMNSLSALVLGVGNGLLVGLIAEEVRVTYTNYEMGRAAREFAGTGMSVDFVETGPKVLVPLVSIIAFGAVSYFVNRYFRTRPRALLSLWLVLGAVAVWAGYFMSTSKPNILSLVWILTFAMMCYLVHRVWMNYRDSLFLLWLVNGVSVVIVVALGVQLTGLLFYWPELRSPLLWLLCLLGVVLINLIYGAVVQFISGRFGGGKLRHANGS